jgi:hypothetical protein
MAANLVAHYPLDSYYVSSGVPRTANLVTGVGSWGDAIVNYSGGLPFQSDFTNTGVFGGSWLETGAGASLRFHSTLDPFAATGSFTYALWVYDPFTTTINQQTFLLSKQAANLDHYFRVILRSGATPTTDDMQIGAYYGVTGSGTFQDRNTGTFQAAGAGDPSTNWVHIAVTGTRTSTTPTNAVVAWQIFANGLPLSMANNTTTLDFTRTNQMLTAGAFASQVAQGYIGTQLDDIRFYDGVLTADEIRAIPGVTPVSASIGVTNGVVTVSWNSFIGNRYQVRKTTDLGSPSWTDVGSLVTATSVTNSASEAQGTDPTYYRVQVLP